MVGIKFAVVLLSRISVAVGWRGIFGMEIKVEVCAICILLRHLLLEPGIHELDRAVYPYLPTSWMGNPPKITCSDAVTRLQ
jgi:hypothetical protein